MDTDSFYLAMSGDYFHKIVKPGMRQVHDVDWKKWLATGKFSRRRPGFLSLNFLVQELYGLLPNAILFNIKIISGKINKAVKVFQKIRMI